MPHDPGIRGHLPVRGLWPRRGQRRANGGGEQIPKVASYGIPRRSRGTRLAVRRQTPRWGLAPRAHAEADPKTRRAGSPKIPLPLDSQISETRPPQLRTSAKPNVPRRGYAQQRTLTSGTESATLHTRPPPWTARGA